ncbi:hypothetical protein D3C81_1151510 [compost metagenome]
MGVAMLVYPAQEEALDDYPEQAHQHGRKQHRAGKADKLLQGVRQVGTHHIKGGMGKVEDAHHAENQSQTGRNHEQQQAVDHAVEQ